MVQLLLLLLLCCLYAEFQDKCWQICVWKHEIYRLGKCLFKVIWQTCHLKYDMVRFKIRLGEVFTYILVMLVGLSECSADTCCVLL